MAFTAHYGYFELIIIFCSPILLVVLIPAMLLAVQGCYARRVGNSFTGSSLGWWFSIEQKLLASTPNFMQDLVFGFKVRKATVIKDPFLGITEKLLMLFVLGWTINRAVASESILYKELPVGHTSFGFLRVIDGEEIFNAVRNWDQSSPELSYCANPIEWATGNQSALNLASNDNKIQCKQLNFGEIVSKTETAAYIKTFQKETLGTVLGCNELNARGGCNGIREGSENLSTILYKYKSCNSQTEQNCNNDKILVATEFETNEATGKKSCACLEMRNFFSMAPEYIGIEVYHTYRGLDVFSEVTGSTAAEDAGWEVQHPLT
jgi:hypothetical protein